MIRELNTRRNHRCHYCQRGLVRVYLRCLEGRPGRPIGTQIGVKEGALGGCAPSLKFHDILALFGVFLFFGYDCGRVEIDQLKSYSRGLAHLILP